MFSSDAVPQRLMAEVKSKTMSDKITVTAQTVLFATKKMRGR
jgi:hypothetical protein